MKKVLNVGGGSRILPSEYDGWEQHLLDIDAAVNPDVVCNAKEILTKRDLHCQYDAVYMSHCLEHFFLHEIGLVLTGLLLSLKSGGKLTIIVPDVLSMISELLRRNLDLHDVWYRVSGGPVTFHDVLYGWNNAMASGNLYYAHRSAPTSAFLSVALTRAGFSEIEISTDGSNLFAKAVK